MHTINLSGFDFKVSSSIWDLWKAYTEGLYADTPANRKLGRVGMTYLEYEKSSKVKKKEIEQTIKEIAEVKRISQIKPPKAMSEEDRIAKFSDFEKDDVIYLDDNYKTNAGNFTITDIVKNSPTGKLLVVHLKDENGKESSFLKSYLIGEGEFKDFQIKDLNYSLQDERPYNFYTKKEALDNFDKQVKSISNKNKDQIGSDAFLKEDIKVALGSISNLKEKTKNIQLDPWGVTLEVKNGDKNEIYSIEALDNKKYSILHFTKNENKTKENMFDSTSLGENISGEELKKVVQFIYNKN